MSSRPPVSGPQTCRRRKNTWRILSSSPALLYEMFGYITPCRWCDMELDGEEGCEGNETSPTAGLRVPESCVGEPSVSVCMPPPHPPWDSVSPSVLLEAEVSALCLWGFSRQMKGKGRGLYFIRAHISTKWSLFCYSSQKEEKTTSISQNLPLHPSHFPLLCILIVLSSLFLLSPAVSIYCSWLMKLLLFSNSDRFSALITDIQNLFSGNFSRLTNHFSNAAFIRLSLFSSL